MLAFFCILFFSSLLHNLDAFVKRPEKTKAEHTKHTFGLSDSMRSRYYKKNGTEQPPLTKTTIAQLPALIQNPGHYTVGADLTFNQPGAAIIVGCSDVDLEFIGHSITLAGEESVGIEVVGSHVTIKNAKIKTNGDYATTGIIVQTSSYVTLESPHIERLATSTKKSDGLAVDLSNNITISNAHIENYSVSIDINDSSSLRVSTANLYNKKGYGIAAQKVSSLKVTQVKTEGQETGMNFENADDILVRDCVFKNERYAISTFDNDTIIIENSSFNGCKFDTTGTTKATIRGCTFNETILDLFYGTFAIVDACTFNKSSYGVRSIAVNNLTVKNCAFNDLRDIGIYTLDGKTLYVENCALHASSESKYAIIATDKVDSITILDCILSAPKSHPDLHGINLFGSRTALVDRVSIDINSQGSEKTPLPAGIFIESYNDSMQTLDVKICNSIIRGSSKVNVLSHSTGLPNCNIAVANCLIEGGETGVLLSNTQNSILENCIVNTCTANGIHITNSIEKGVQGISKNNIISNCSLTSNGKNGIFIEESVGTTLLKNNQVFGNGLTGIRANHESRLYDNICFNNGGH